MDVGHPGHQSTRITDNVVDLLLGKLRRLAPATQEALQLAACIGNRFDIDTLALIQKSTPHETFESLRPAARRGARSVRCPSSRPPTPRTCSLTAVVQVFGFQHDRVQQAAYGLIEEDRQRDVHLTIGRRLQATLPADALKERTFEVVDHLNFGRELITDKDERTGLAKLNVDAARKASEASAYTAALSYVRIAQGLLRDDGWQKSYELTIEAFRQRAERT